MSKFYDLEAKLGNGENFKFDSLKGKVTLVVNTASNCGYTGQYEGLETIYKELKDKNFEILAFPCNQFGKQEPGSDEEIAHFCQLNYQTSFPLFSKVDVNGDDTHPVYDFLKAEKSGLLGSKAIKWNFTKFLIDSEGKVLKRYAPQNKPEEIKADIDKLI